MLTRRFLLVLCVLACQSSLSAQIEILPRNAIDSLIKRSKTDSLSMYERANLALKARDYASIRQDNDLLYQANLSAGIAYISVSEYDKSLACFQDAYANAQQLEDERRKAESSFYLGEVHQMLDQLAPSSKYYAASFDNYRQLQDTFWLAIVLNSQGVIHSKEKNFQKALPFYEQSLAMFNAGGFVRESSMAISNIGEYYLDLGQPDQAIPHFQEALNIAQSSNIGRAESIYRSNLGIAEQKLGHYERALQLLNESLQQATELQFAQGMVDNYLDLSETYKLMGDYAQALSYYEKYHSLQDSIIGQEKTKLITELEVLYEAESQKRKLEETNKALAISEQKRQIMLLTLGLISLAVLLSLGSVLFLIYRSRVRKEMHLLELEKQIAQSDQLKDTLKKKEQDLVNFGLDIARKNDFSNQIYQQLGQIVEANPDVARKKARDLLNFTSSHLQINKEIRQFQDNVEQVNQDFFNRLLQQFPDLTPSEKQICGLIRLNLSNKDIASIKNTSVKAVEMARYRLRKKLALDAKQDINQFLQTF